MKRIKTQIYPHLAIQSKQEQEQDQENINTNTNLNTLQQDENKYKNESKDNYFCHNRILNPMCLTTASPEYLKLDEKSRKNARYYQDLGECENDCSPASNAANFPLQREIARFLSPKDLLNYEKLNLLSQNNVNLRPSEKINFALNFPFLSRINLPNQVLIDMYKQKKYDDIEGLLGTNLKENRLIYSPSINRILNGPGSPQTRFRQKGKYRIQNNQNLLKFLRFLIMNNFIPTFKVYLDIFQELLNGSFDELGRRCVRMLQEEERKNEYNIETEQGEKNDFDKLIDLIIYKLDPNPSITTSDNLRDLIIEIAYQFRVEYVLSREIVDYIQKDSGRYLICKINEIIFRIMHILKNIFAKFPDQIRQIYGRVYDDERVIKDNLGFFDTLQYYLLNPINFMQIENFVGIITDVKWQDLVMNTFNAYLQALGYFYLPDPERYQEYFNTIKIVGTALILKAAESRFDRNKVDQDDIDDNDDTSNNGDHADNDVDDNEDVNENVNFNTNVNENGNNDNHQKENYDEAKNNGNDKNNDNNNNNDIFIHHDNDNNNNGDNNGDNSDDDHDHPSQYWQYL